MTGILCLPDMKYSKFALVFTITTLFVFLMISQGVAQKKEVRKEKKSAQQEAADNSFSPFTPDASFDKETLSESKNTRKSRKKRKKEMQNTYRYEFLKSLDQKKEEFYKRIKENAKEDRKMARKMRKPQYSDPMYFGHKKKPKKRPVGKRKLCKECGIVH